MYKKVKIKRRNGWALQVRSVNSDGCKRLTVVVTCGCARGVVVGVVFVVRNTNASSTTSCGSTAALTRVQDYWCWARCSRCSCSWRLHAIVIFGWPTVPTVLENGNEYFKVNSHSDLLDLRWKVWLIFPPPLLPPCSQSRLRPSTYLRRSKIYCCAGDLRAVGAAVFISNPPRMKRHEGFGKLFFAKPL